MPRRTGTNKCLSHKLMQVFRFHAFISVSTNRTCESSGRASPISSSQLSRGCEHQVHEQQRRVRQHDMASLKAGALAMGELPPPRKQSLAHEGYIGRERARAEERRR